MTVSCWPQAFSNTVKSFKLGIANGQKPKANSQDLKVTIAAGITSSHSEQSS